MLDQAMLGVKAGGTWSVVEAPTPSNADTPQPRLGDRWHLVPGGRHVRRHRLLQGLDGHFLGLDRHVLRLVSWTATDPRRCPRMRWRCGRPGLPQVGRPRDGPVLRRRRVRRRDHRLRGPVGLIDTYRVASAERAAPAPQPADAAILRLSTSRTCRARAWRACRGRVRRQRQQRSLAGPRLRRDRRDLLVRGRRALPPGSGSGADEESELSSISCAGVLARRRSTSMTRRPMMTACWHRAWAGRGRPLAAQPANGGTGSNQNAGLDDVSCTFDGICNAVGYYDDEANGVARAFIDTVAGATSPPRRAWQPADAATWPTSTPSSMHPVPVRLPAHGRGSYQNNSNSGTMSPSSTRRREARGATASRPCP